MNSPSCIQPGSGSFGFLWRPWFNSAVWVASALCVAVALLGTGVRAWPNQRLTEDGTAFVAPAPPFPDLSPRTLPSKNRPVQEITILRIQHPQGQVVNPQGSPPSTIPAILPITGSSGDRLDILGDTYAEWPDGIVAWFYA